MSAYDLACLGVGVGFFGGAAALAGMGVSVVWEAGFEYRLFSSAGVIFGVLFAACFIVAVLLVGAKEEANKEPDSTENQVTNA